MNDKFVDLHIHTNASDGSSNISEIVELADLKGLSAIAITDHNTIDAVLERSGKMETSMVEIIPGIELDIDYKSIMHMQGLFLDIHFEELKHKLDKLKKRKFQEIILLTREFRKLGIKLDLDAIEKSYGRINYHNISKYLLREKMAKNEQEIYTKYFKHISINQFKFEFQDGLNLVKKACGLAILAHPNSLNLNYPKLKSLVMELQILGLDGIECFHPSFGQSDQKMYLALAQDLNLLISGGSDYHGCYKNYVLGESNVPVYYLEKLQTYLKNR